MAFFFVTVFNETEYEPAGKSANWSADRKQYDVQILCPRHIQSDRIQ